MTNTPSLLPCPFCGGMATAKPIDSVHGWHHVTVLHSDCFYKPAQDKMLLNDEHLAAWNRRTPQPTQAVPPAGREPLTPEQINAAAKKLAECLDYPWDYMTYPGQAEMRRHAQAVIEAANGIKAKEAGNAE